MIIRGDCRLILESIPDDSIDCIVTSPPYWGLRDYGANGQIGFGCSLDDYISDLVSVFSQCRRVLKPTGTFWLNIGDMYVCGSHKIRGLRTKEIIGVPWRLAFALQADGWYLRQDIIWRKPNPMPESVRDRFTKSHEYIFLLTKSAKYHFKQIKEPATYAGQSRGGSRKRYEQNAAGMDNKIYDTRNKRSVWDIRPASGNGSHYAVFPIDLPQICVEAGCPEGGTVLDPFCGSGTVAKVCRNRSFIGIEINPKYADLAQENDATN